MTVADIHYKQFWWKIVPKSWYLSESGDRSSPPWRDPQPKYSERDRERDLDLDDTRSFRRRYDDSPPTPKVQVPFGVIITIVIYLIGQLVGGVWWAATLQSNLQHEIADRSKEESRLWQTVETYRLQVEALRVEIARSGSKVDTRKRVIEEE